MKNEKRTVRLDIMDKFATAAPEEALGLNATVDGALDYVRTQIENYVALKLSDERIVEAIRRTTGIDIFMPDDIRRARGRWARADKKAQKEAKAFAQKAAVESTAESTVAGADNVKIENDTQISMF